MRVGILGGFGAYAGIDFYQRFVSKFTLDTERNLPHIIMDNNFTMPSRTKALLTGKGYSEVVNEIAESIRWMMQRNVDYVVLACGTAHYFLPDVYRLIPNAKRIVVDMLDSLGEALKARHVEHVLVIAAEGALSKQLFSNRLYKYDIECMEPREKHYAEIRYFIECVKRNKFEEDTEKRLEIFLEEFSETNIVLGCTEFPILVEKMNIRTSCTFYDPIDYVLDDLYKLTRQADIL